MEAFVGEGSRRGRNVLPVARKDEGSEASKASVRDIRTG